MTVKQYNMAGIALSILSLIDPLQFEFQNGLRFVLLFRFSFFGSRCFSPQWMKQIVGRY